MGLYICYIYLDLQKAFDTVNQNILLAKLKHGIKGISFDWFKSFICDRVQYTSYKSPQQKLFLMEFHKVQ